MYVGRWLMVNEVSPVQAAVSPLVTLATSYNLTIFSTSSNTRQPHTTSKILNKTHTSHLHHLQPHYILKYTRPPKHAQHTYLTNTHHLHKQKNKPQPHQLQPHYIPSNTHGNLTRPPLHKTKHTHPPKHIPPSPATTSLYSQRPQTYTTSKPAQHADLTNTHHLHKQKTNLNRTTHLTSTSYNLTAFSTSTTQHTISKRHNTQTKGRK